MVQYTSFRFATHMFAAPTPLDIMVFIEKYSHASVIAYYYYFVCSNM